MPSSDGGGSPIGFEPDGQPVGQHGADAVPEQRIRAFIVQCGQQGPVQVIEERVPVHGQRLGAPALPSRQGQRLCADFRGQQAAPAPVGGAPLPACGIRNRRIRACGGGSPGVNQRPADAWRVPVGGCGPDCADQPRRLPDTPSCPSLSYLFELLRRGTPRACGVMGC